jgi:hypothetical protein
MNEGGKRRKRKGKDTTTVADVLKDLVRVSRKEK